jgi:hypothetical protein
LICLIIEEIKLKVIPCWRKWGNLEIGMVIIGYLSFDLLVLLVTLCNRVALHGLIIVLRPLNVVLK